MASAQTTHPVTLRATDPGEAPVASDSGSTNFGIDNSSNQPGEKDIKGFPVDTAPDNANANRKS